MKDQTVYKQLWYLKNKTRIKAARHRRYLANRDSELAYMKEWRATHKEHVAKYLSEWLKKNWVAYHRENRSRLLAHQKKWRIKNGVKVVQSANNRRLVMLRRIPAWADLRKIAAVYGRARRRRLVVDHIVPLQGRTVSGLHVHTNLRVVTFKANATKGNRLIEALL